MKFTLGRVDEDVFDTTTASLKVKYNDDACFPASTLPDGNCLVCVISRFWFGTQHRYQEVCVYMVIRLLFMRTFSLLKIGLQKSFNQVGESTWGVELLCMEYKWNDLEHTPKTLDVDTLHTVFRGELLLWSKDECWLGMWHLHIASALCQQHIKVVHAMAKRNHNWNVYNCFIYAVNDKEIYIDAADSFLHIMFTTTNTGVTVPKLNNMNHWCAIGEERYK